MKKILHLRWGPPWRRHREGRSRSRCWEGGSPASPPPSNSSIRVTAGAFRSRSTNSGGGSAENARAGATWTSRCARRSTGRISSSALRQRLRHPSGGLRGAGVRSVAAVQDDRGRARRPQRPRHDGATGRRLLVALEHPPAPVARPAGRSPHESAGLRVPLLDRKARRPGAGASRSRPGAGRRRRSGEIRQGQVGQRRRPDRPARHGREAFRRASAKPARPSGEPAEDARRRAQGRSRDAQRRAQGQSRLGRNEHDPRPPVEFLTNLRGRDRPRHGRRRPHIPDPAIRRRRQRARVPRLALQLSGDFGNRQFRGGLRHVRHRLRLSRRGQHAERRRRSRVGGPDAEGARQLSRPGGLEDAHRHGRRDGGAALSGVAAARGAGELLPPGRRPRARRRRDNRHDHDRRPGHHAELRAVQAAHQRERR